MSGPGTPGRSTALRRRAAEAAEGSRRELGAAQALEATGGSRTVVRRGRPERLSPGRGRARPAGGAS
eukprot:2465720-Alexandrium_andersonii.AAC.1